jgi:hypothetical protein
MAGLRERAREEEERDDKWGLPVSESKRGRARAEQVAVLGRAGADASGPLGWAEPGAGKEVSPSSFLFFFFQIMNSTNICLFH